MVVATMYKIRFGRKSSKEIAEIAELAELAELAEIAEIAELAENSDIEQDHTDGAFLRIRGDS